MKHSKNLVFLLVIFGVIAGYFIIPFVHEAGHFTIACISNCSAIKEFVYSPQVALTQLTPSGNFSGYEIRYVANPKVVYGDYGILVYLGGFIFEISLFAAVVLLMRKFGKEMKKPRSFKIFVFLLGFLVVFINSSFTWIADFVAIMRLYLNFDLLAIYAFVYSLLIAIYIVWFHFLWKYLGIFKSSLPKKKRHMNRRAAK